MNIGHMSSTARRLRRLPRWVNFTNIMAALVYFYLILPSLTVIPISFSEDFSLGHFSWVLYERILESSNWTNSIARSALIAAVSSTLAILLGVPAAYAFSRGRFAGRGMAQLLVVSPLFVPVIIMALGLYYLGAWTGMLDTFALFILAHSTYAMPFVIVLVLSGLRQVPADLEQAGYIMGASSIRVFLQIVLPQLRIPVLAGWLFGFLVSFDEVIIAWFISGPRTETLPVRMYSSIMWDNTPEIAAISTMLTIFSFLICLVMIKVGGVSPLKAPR